MALLGLFSLYMLPVFSAVRAKETHDRRYAMVDRVTG